MFDWKLNFDAPYYWLLAVGLPLFWLTSRRSLAALGRFRKTAAVLLRMLVVLLIVAALAEVQTVRNSDRLTVIFLVDQSRSIPDQQREAMRRYVEEASLHRNEESGDRFGAIYFARSPKADVVPIDESPPLSSVAEVNADATFDRDFTNLALAMRQAQAMFPEDGAKRIVVVTDGNENLGDAAAQAQFLADAGVGVDVVPIRINRRNDVAVEKVALSGDVRRGEPFDLRVTLDAQLDEGQSEIAGRLEIFRKAGDQVEPLNPTLEQQRVTLVPGKNVFTFRETIESPDFYTYEARFTPDDPSLDPLGRNNRATAFTHVRGRGQALVIRDWNRGPDLAGEFETMIDRLRREDIEISLMSSDRLFGDLAELQRYDAVILANVARTSGDTAGNLAGFSDQQIAMLVQNTQQFGAGLVMIGGRNGFGAGGWTGTELEEAMPVEFQIKNAKVKAVGALAMIMHASEIDAANFWQQKIAEEAIKGLGPEDFCGLIHWNGVDAWLWNNKTGGMAQVGENRQQMLAALGRMTPGDMPDFDPSMRRALAGLLSVKQAAVKHMIVISDGDPTPASNAVLAACKQAGIKVTTVAVGAHGTFGHPELQRIANATGGKYYVVKNNAALPKIYQQEVRRISRSLIYEKPDGFTPRIASPHEMLKGIDEPLPPLTGFVMTTVKDQAEVAIVSPVPANDRNNVILAGWTYGAGKTVALTTDGGDVWATRWAAWEGYDKLMSQIVRWAMRPAGDTGKFSVAAETTDGRTQVVVTALGEADEALNFLDMRGSAVGPDLKPIRLEFTQTAPGRYVGEFSSAEAGSYLIHVSPGGGKAPIRTGVNVPYSAEFRDRQSNLALLEKLLLPVPAGGEPGKKIDDPTGESDVEKLLAVDVFRHDLAKATSRQDVWHLAVLLAGCLFFFDVLVRRVAIGFAWAGPMFARARNFVLRRDEAAPPAAHIERLKSRKSTLSEQFDERRAASRLEPDPSAGDVADDLEKRLADDAAAKTKSRPTGRTDLAPEKEVDDYTTRLKKAKQSALDKRRRNDDDQTKPDE